MAKKSIKQLGLLLAVLCLYVTAYTQTATATEEVAEEVNKTERPMAISLKIGTSGPGLELSKQVNNALDVRLGSTYFKYQTTLTPPNLSMDVSMNLQSQTAYLLFDFYNGNSRLLRFTGGLAYNLSSITGDGQAEGTYTMNTLTVTGEDIGSISYEITPNTINPYIGVGLGSIVPKKKIGVSFDAGLLYIGRPDVNLEATGFIEPTAQQEDLIRSNISNANIFPVFSTQITYRF